MPYTFKHLSKSNAPSFNQLYQPIEKAIIRMLLKMEFEDQLKALIHFHLEGHTSAQHLLQIIEEYDFERNAIAVNSTRKSEH